MLCVADAKHVDTSIHLDDPRGPIERSRIYSERVVRDATAELERAGFVVNGHVVEGIASAEVLIYLEHDSNDLVVLGAGNKTWMGRLLHGSVSMHVLHTAPISVLVVHESAGGTGSGKARVLVAEDGSAGAKHARSDLAEFTDPETCDVTVLSVVSLVDLAVMPNREILTPDVMPLDSIEVGKDTVRRRPATPTP